MSDTVAANAALAPLAAFVGTWTTQGEVKLLGPSGRGAPYRATDTYEWLPGGHFLLHRFVAQMPDGAVEGIEVIGYDASRKHFTMHSYDNQGNANVMQASVDGEQWTYSGNNVRFRGNFSEDGRVFSGTWEMRERLNVAWRTWMSVALRRDA
ncbi:MAG TPA: DUF1579 family protein [Tahibacter sp.]|uniref:DUF1579 family protein n=1 Tax=Tahibacter sp. TaxID=2056211 RepID=UPI002D0D85B0|nr:DUF1579 family protein [Tahibacter sp.]HSX61295.1 DUF1579 family protein [Tahibacter sp.]